MKKITILFVVFALAFQGKAQTLELGLGVGSGAAYLFENSDKSVNISYSLPFSSFADLKYSHPDRYFGGRLKFQYLNTGVEGDDWKSGMYTDNVNGDVSSFTAMLLLEHLKTDKPWNFGYNFGIGYTNQKLRYDLVYHSYQIETGYMSAALGGIINRKLTENLSLTIEPSLFWTDPVNSLRNSDKWQIAGEDLSILVQVGIRYKIGGRR